VSPDIKGEILEIKEDKVLHCLVERDCIWLWGTQDKWHKAIVRPGF